MKKMLFTEEQMTEMMEMCYISVLNGVPGSKNCEELAAEYRRKYNGSKTAAQNL